MEFAALETIAEVSVALAGFATLGATLGINVGYREAIYGVVSNSAIALMFSLAALRFADSDFSTRVLAALLFAASVLIVMRGWRQVAIAQRTPAYRSADQDATMIFLGRGAAAAMLLAPILSGLALLAVFPGQVKLLYEAALLGQLSVAVLLLVFVVYSTIAARPTPPAE